MTRLPLLGQSSAGVEYDDLLMIYEREEAEARAKVCPVCRVPYDAPSLPHRRDRRYIQVITGPDEWDTYACPACRPEQYREDSEKYRDRPADTERVLARAARDRAAGRRMTDAEHRETLCR